MMEYAAAARYKILVDPTGQTPGSWFTLPREARASMAAFVNLDTLGEGMAQYDAAEQREADRAALGKRGK